MMQNQVLVRHATLANLESCRLLDHAATELAIRHAIEQQAVVLADIDGETVGYLRPEFLWSRIPYIALVWVVKSRRGQGIGRSMLSFTESDLRMRGHKMLLSSSQMDETVPQTWHRTVGFEQCGILDGINEGGVGEMFFRKKLTSKS